MSHDAAPDTISYTDFLKVDVRVVRVLKAEPFPKARRPAYKLWVDFGPQIGTRKTSAQITKHYTPEELPGRLVLGVVNFPPKQVADFMSEVLLLGAMPDEDSVVLIHPEREVPPGTRML